MNFHYNFQPNKMLLKITAHTESIQQPNSFINVTNPLRNYNQTSFIWKYKLLLLLFWQLTRITTHLDWLCIKTALNYSLCWASSAICFKMHLHLFFSIPR